MQSCGMSPRRPSTEDQDRPSPLQTVSRAIPGLLACAAIALAAFAGGDIERRLFGSDWVGPVVLAILIGAIVRLGWKPSQRFQPGIQLGAGLMLEIAIVLLGATVSAAALSALGPALMLAIVAFVPVALLFGFGIGRLMGLEPRMALLIASGNAICGNSAIVAIAPAIGARSEEVATAIAFTAVLGLLLVLSLPLIGGLTGMDPVAFGTVAGLSVYAVPQVLAATAPIGPVALQTGTLVKLMRVLMLGPVVVVLSMLFRKREAGADPGPPPPLHRLVPWFIVGFMAMVTARALDLIPQTMIEPLWATSGVLTVLSMAALGLQTDLKQVLQASGRVAATVLISLAGLIGIALVLVQALRL